jgi:hypothetical protein
MTKNLFTVGGSEKISAYLQRPLRSLAEVEEARRARPVPATDSEQIPADPAVPEAALPDET